MFNDRSISKWDRKWLHWTSKTYRGKNNADKRKKPVPSIIANDSIGKMVASFPTAKSVLRMRGRKLNPKFIKCIDCGAIGHDRHISTMPMVRFTPTVVVYPDGSVIIGSWRLGSAESEKYLTERGISNQRSEDVRIMVGREKVLIFSTKKSGVVSGGDARRDQIQRSRMIESAFTELKASSALA